MRWSAAIYWLALAAGILLTSVSQVLLKVGATSRSRLVDAFINRLTLSGYALFVVVTAFNVFAMKAIPLRTVTAATSLTYVLTLALGKWILGETVGRRTMCGLSLIVAGIVVYSAAGVL